MTIVGSYNIHKAVGTDLRRDPSRVVQVIAEMGADIVGLQEVDRRFGDRRGVLDPTRLAAETGLTPVMLTDRLGKAAHGWHGNLLLVRGALVERAEAISLPGLEPRGAIMADIRLHGQPLRVITAHLGLLRQSRLLQSRLLARHVAATDGRPTLVMGDFNEWRLGADCGLMPLRRELRAVKRSALTRPSFPARMPVLPLDRIMACPQLDLHDLRAHDSPLARRASDHLPLRAALRLPQAQSAVM
ncbi:MULTISPECIES: endonuclease/exonuclease/phosphatase family protein [Roseinatronobacter]|uniref:Endonuclease/exonuclease/phosphatase family protein n=1 Tax=Roseinatronobacter domitianus TaxID=2940293 RepID=A0ABT0M4L4_9RHOB|nr:MULTISPECIES: endonuclease/exonuclease/phosphatase family protein [Roseibaca]MCL1629801.1 endonuclease/exonuclease/phosphatase family protein [Roseibaca domitiana]